MRLQGKVALVTGAGSGIGEATAKRFGREGASVVVNDMNEANGRRVADEIASAGGKAIFVAGDVSKKVSVDDLAKRAVEAFGQVDILVNNAGITRDSMSYKMTEEAWDQVMAVNLKGSFLAAQSVLPGMKERGFGRVINTSSVGALGNVGQANYAASKAGVIGLTKTLALEYAKFGVTVNAVAPGATETAMFAGVPDKVKEMIVGKIPMGRMAKPDDIAGVHLFLASDDAAYVTGQVIFTDGGMTTGA